jgi:hypothetical protein
MRLFLISSFLLSTSLFAATAFLADPAKGLSVQLDEDGTYSVTSRPMSWTFAGKVASGAWNIEQSVGVDDSGIYQAIRFDFHEGGPRRAEIRLYLDRGSVLFRYRTLENSPNATYFPQFTVLPRGLDHLAYDGIFGLASFYALPQGGPWQFFDSRGRSYVLSPASRFNVISLEQTPQGAVRAGVNPRIETLPAGFELQTLLTIGHGPNATFQQWGDMMRALNGKSRPRADADVSLEKLGYWTDAGATYYYHQEPGMSYATTLRTVLEEVRRKGIQPGYLQLDSWFYPKGEQRDWGFREGGIWEYRADRSLFPDLKAFRDQIGIPLLTHSRWIDRASPYRTQFQISGNVSVDPLFWQQVARYLADSGVTIYEQDWLGLHAQAAENLNDSREFFRNMAEAMRAHNITIQYCMATPRHFLESLRHSNVTTIRVSEDRFDETRWDDFLYGSRFAWALGVYPFTDVFMSSETGNLLLASLSAGPVGIGDKIGEVDAANLARVARKDGVLVKPDAPLTPLDSVLLADAREPDPAKRYPLVAATYSEHEAGRISYVTSHPRGEIRTATVSVEQLGMAGPVYVYRPFERAGELVQTNFEMRTEDKLGFAIVSPMVNGIALLGDLGHFASAGRKRLRFVRPSQGVTTRVEFAPGEEGRIISGYSAGKPKVQALKGVTSLDSYDESTGLFHVRVQRNEELQAEFEVSLEAP